jgi:hypothetical protein
MNYGIYPDKQGVATPCLMARGKKMTLYYIQMLKGIND